MNIQHFFDPKTNTISYVVYYPGRPEAIVVDPVWDFDLSAARFSTESYENLKAFLLKENLLPVLILETHVHADHVTASQLLRKDWPGTPIMIGSRISEVQKHFKAVFGFGDWMQADGSQFDILMGDNDERQLGPFKIKALSAPGHTPVDTIYQIGDALFVGDIVFMPDSGTGRCDFHGGDAEAMYHSVHDKLFKLPENLMIYVCHDYQPGGRELRYKCTVGEARQANIHIKDGTKQNEFVQFRKQRDSTLAVPKLILPSLQVNMNAGNLPQSDAAGKVFLKLPITE